MAIGIGRAEAFPFGVVRLQGKPWAFPRQYRKNDTVLQPNGVSFTTAPCTHCLRALPAKFKFIHITKRIPNKKK